MRRILVLWKSNLVVFVSSFCLMVIELLAARLLAPYIGVSLYSWTSIIGVMLGGIAFGNYVGGKISDRYPFPNLLAILFFSGGLATVAILPVVQEVTLRNWFGGLPVIVDFTLKSFCIFFPPATLLSMISPLVIKLALRDLDKAGGTVGTVYAWSTVGSILGTFMTGFYFILWFGIRMTIWIVAGVLVLTGVAIWIFWQSPGRWKPSPKNWMMLGVTIITVVSYISLFQLRGRWQENYTRESNYYSITVRDEGKDMKVLILDYLTHSGVSLKDPTFLRYGYLKAFAEITGYVTGEKPAPSVLHLGGGGYSFPRYLEATYPGSENDVAEIDPVVTEVAYAELGLPGDTTIRTYNQDARLFLGQRISGDKYDIVVGDVFNDRSTPYHLTTLEFDRLVKASLTPDGIYLINIIDDYRVGRYMPSFIYTLKNVFNHVYLFSQGVRFEYIEKSNFVILATDRAFDVDDFWDFVTGGGSSYASSLPLPDDELVKYLAARNPILLTDDHAPTDILVLELFK